MLSKKIMEAADAACQSVCMGEEAALHYGGKYTRLQRWTAWWQGFVAGWVGTPGYLEVIPLHARLSRFVRHHYRNVPLKGASR